MALKNVEYKVNGGKLQITVDLSKKSLESAEMSKTGKSKIVGTTGGFQGTGIDGVSFALNVVTKATAPTA